MMTKNVALRVFDALVLSIPLCVMGLLAAVTFWLVVMTPEILNIAKTKSVRDAPDLIVNNFVVERFDRDGSLRSNLKADMAQRFPAKDEIVVTQLNLMTTESTDHREAAQPVLGTAGVDFFRITTIAEQSILHSGNAMIELLGNAYVTRQPYFLQGDSEKLEFLGDELKIWLEDEKMTSDLPVDISQEGTRFTANAMTYDYSTNTFQLRGRVVGNFEGQP